MVFPLSQPERSPLARLVLFVVCLSVAGLIGAGALSFIGTITQQQNPQSPMNEYPCPYGDLKKTMVACEKACLIPDGPMDIYCYEYCIDEVCYHH